ncbi:hypothetical protein HOE425_333055 [Hoeflea sp. EC-HK425]|nr:hypothetical protein HOE425_333055 [Hoeflea sp. EC-HK425]
MPPLYPLSAMPGAMAFAMLLFHLPACEGLCCIVTARTRLASPNSWNPPNGEIGQYTNIYLRWKCLWNTINLAMGRITIIFTRYWYE